MTNVKENRKKWVAALRSGEYEQGREKLCHKGKYCCLGVLCSVYEHETGEQLPKDARGYDGSSETLTPFPQVRKWVGLKHPEGYFDGIVDVPDVCLVALNDQHSEYDFYVLADLIESEPEGLFV